MMMKTRMLDLEKPKQSCELNLFRKLTDLAKLSFDYEVNTVFFNEQDDSEAANVYMIDNSVTSKNYKQVDFQGDFWDDGKVSPDGSLSGTTYRVKANCVKRLVSKKKRRLQNELFDIDLAYITKRVIAMGYPSTGCESLWRNTLTDTKNFLNRYHKEYKVYNLCLEKGRIYRKEAFDGRLVALFPFTDHDPCPIKLMLEFCVDICLYLTNRKEGVAAVHCKAGKGRTGVMIICYLIFSGICPNSEAAIKHYAMQRTYNGRGVTIPSQMRYIKYFETYLSTNFTRPYVKMIPKIMKYYINPSTTNIIKNYITDDSYFNSENSFYLKKLRIGPFKTQKTLKYKIFSLISKNIPFYKAKSTITSDDNKNFYFEVSFNSDIRFNYDICLEIKAFRIKFYTWVNLWYATIEIISRYIIENKLFVNADRFDVPIYRESCIDKFSTFLEMKKKLDFYATDLDIRTVYSVNNSGMFQRQRANSNKTLGQLIDELKYDKDLNKLINGINNLATERGVLPLDRENLSIALTACQLDKFNNAKAMERDFKVVFTFSILE